MSLPQPTSRRGFTLTELLVVIAIIAILASLAGAGIMAAMNRARATAIKVELDQIDSAMKRYKETYGSYPPTNIAFDEASLPPADKAKRLGGLRQHLAMAFPRYSADENRLRRDLTAAGMDLQHVRPDQALVFWLQGFGADPTSPILSTDNRAIHPTTGAVNPADPVQKRTNNFFEFDPTRLAAHPTSGAALNPAPSYFPANARIATATVAGKTFPEWSSGAPPIVYFDSQAYEFQAPVLGGDEAKANRFNHATVFYADAGVVTPYWHDRNGNGTTNVQDDFDSQEGYANPDSYQLIAAGGDGKYGVVTPPNDFARRYPSGINYDITGGTDDDNATNFTASTRLGDDLP